VYWPLAETVNLSDKPESKSIIESLSVHLPKVVTETPKKIAKVKR